MPNVTYPTCPHCYGELELQPFCKSCNTWHLICKDCKIWQSLDMLAPCSWYTRCKGCDLIGFCDQRKLQSRLNQFGGNKSVGQN